VLCNSLAAGHEDLHDLSVTWLSCSLLSSLEMMHESLLLHSFFPKVYQSNRENETWCIGVTGYWRGAKRGLGAFIQCVDRAVGAIVVLCWCWQNIPALHSTSFDSQSTSPDSVFRFELVAW
jgi:hypothetical protein